MKSVFLLCAIFVYYIIYQYYIARKYIIIEYIDSIHPRLYSSSNLQVSTVYVSTLKITENNTYVEVDERDPILLPNSIYRYEPQIFNIDDTNELSKHGLLCSPNSYGFSIEQGKKLFPDYTYPKCSDVTGIKQSSLHIDREKNQIFMTCGNNNGEFVYGPFNSNKLIVLGETKFHKSSGNGAVDYKNVEFGFGSCSDDKNNFHNAVLEPVFNKDAYNNALKRMEPGKPTIIYFLTIDSVSRRHFFRKLPKTVDYFNNLKRLHPNFVVYDYKLHSIFGQVSVENQVPIFGRVENFVHKFSGNQNIDKLGKHAIWNILREKGYISLMGLDECDYSFPESLGRNPNVDYMVREFYCYAQQKLSIETAGFQSKQRCIGPYMNHYYILNYTHTVARLNQGVNQWLFLHLNAAHEKSGQHTSTLNDDLTHFIDLFIKDYGKNNNIIILLQSDHGSPWISQQGINGQNEFKLPTLFIIANKSLMDKFPSSYHALNENTYRLVLKQDLRQTMLSVAGISETSNGSIDLLNEIALKSRHCEYLSMWPETCTCTRINEFKNFTDSHIELFKKLSFYAESEINSLSYSHEKNHLGSICKKITLDNITSVYHSQFNNVNELFRLTIKSSTRENMEFRIDFFISSDNKRMDYSKYNIYAFNNKHYPIKVRVRDN